MTGTILIGALTGGCRPNDLIAIRELARTYGPEAISSLVKIMRSKTASDNARATAAMAILDRGYGKPERSVTATFDDKRDATDWTREELVAFLNDARDKGTTH